MADEKKLEEFKQRLEIGLHPASSANLTRTNKAIEKECSLSDATSSIYSSTNTTGIKIDFDQVPVAKPATLLLLLKIPFRHPSFRPVALLSYRCSSTSVDVTNATTVLAGSRPNASVSGPSSWFNSRYSNSLKTSATVDAKVSRVPLSSKSVISTHPSNLSNFSHQTQRYNSSDKVPQVGSDIRSAVINRDSYSARNFSLVSNQVQGLFPNGASSYQTNIGSWGGYDGYNLGEKFNRSSSFEAQKEATRGPRSRRVHNLMNLSDEKEQFGPRVRRDGYNLPDFQISYDNAKFFVIKSYSEDDIHKSIKYDVWSSTPTGNKKLNAAFNDAQTRHSETGTGCPIFLFFSVNGSGQFLGLAEMNGPVDFEKNMDFWQQDKWSGFFHLKWHIIKDIPNNRLRHIILENNDNKPVTYTRDTQEVGLKQGLEMLSIFKTYPAMTSMLDDYKFYEDQQKSLQARKGSKEEPSNYDNHKTEFLERDFEAGLRKAEEAPMTVRKVSEYTSLATLARNLSLNPKSTIAGNNSRKV
ncbi:hypothetical protein IFM89_009905 [Coptis chinensis]|uniref:YTH domain-containing family protein n=1 Tax=Coptis chinensis TaxID=261450 RepID=A0A835I0Z3_9MAGN|nr:hypothetical protein IFM89_009905 [Coptis chinensis]